MELLYSLPAIAATISTTGATCINTAATIFPYQLPALQNIWTPSQMVGKSFMFLFAGGYNITAAAENLALQFSLDIALATTAASSGTVAAIGLSSVPTTATGMWEAQVFMGCVSATGTISTWYSSGQLTVGPGNTESGAATATATTYMWGQPAVALGVPTAVTIPSNVGLFPGLYSKWTGNGGCTIVTTQMMVFGNN